MASMVYNSREFSLQVKRFEKQAYDSAIEKAGQLVKNKSDIMIYRDSRKICEEAFEVFKKNVQTTFPAEVYRNLTDLTFQSREKLFFITLKDEVVKIFRPSNSNEGN